MVSQLHSVFLLYGIFTKKKYKKRERVNMISNNIIYIIRWEEVYINNILRIVLVKINHGPIGFSNGNYIINIS